MPGNSDAHLDNKWPGRQIAVQPVIKQTDNNCCLLLTTSRDLLVDQCIVVPPALLLTVDINSVHKINTGNERSEKQVPEMEPRGRSGCLCRPSQGEAREDSRRVWFGSISS